MLARDDHNRQLRDLRTSVQRFGWRQAKISRIGHRRSKPQKLPLKFSERSRNLGAIAVAANKFQFARCRPGPLAA
jgi:hypothetical protein